MKISFFGATQEVTGSRFLIEKDNAKILVECGLFQGGKDLRRHNWEPFAIDPSSIDAVVLTHAHIDHTGYVPALVKNGFKGKVYCSHATYALCQIMLIDSAALQEEAAKRFAKKQPLYSIADAQQALKHFAPIAYDTKTAIANGLDVTLICSGHILGASFVVISDGDQAITFSGDLGRPNQYIMKAPPAIKQTDYLVLESTYGDRLHEDTDPMKVLGDMINKTVAQGGVVIIPAFAVGRTQMILYCLYQLKEKKVIPDIPVFLDSPMAISVTNLFCKFSDEHKLQTDLCSDVFDRVTYTKTVKESRRLDSLSKPAIIIAGSGMADGGRVADHFKHYISDAKNMVIFVGFQARGTEGRALIEGAHELEIDDKIYPVNAAIEKINGLSAHADYREILQWLSHFEKTPKETFLVHGEKESAHALKEKIETQFGWQVIIPKYGESFDLE